MASKLQADKNEKVKLRTRKGHDMTWSCKKHPLPIALYCKEHSLPVCDRCAIKEHCQKPCELDDIEDVILETRRKLDDRQDEIENRKKQLETLDHKIESIATFSSNHLQMVDDEFKSIHKDKSMSAKDEEEKKLHLINEEADEEIRIINKKRDRRIKSCNAELEKQQQIIEESQAKLFSETKAISEVVFKNIKDLTHKNQHAISTMYNIDAKIKQIKQDDERLVNEAPQVLASLDDNLSSNVHQDVSDCLDRIQGEVQRVKFVEGEVCGEHYSRIDGYIGEWMFLKSIDIPENVRKPVVFGLISDNEICMRNVENDVTYVTNTRTGHTEAIEGGAKMYIASCAPIDSNVIVCVRLEQGCTGFSCDRSITLYDRQWKVIRYISIPTNNDLDSNIMFVDVDRDGMILAAQIAQSYIYVINPTDGKIVNTITMHGKVVRGEVQTFSSGDIVVKTDNNEFTVISRSGEEKAVFLFDEWRGLLWNEARCRVDKLTDTLHITYWNTEPNIRAVDQMSCDGIIQARRIVEYDDQRQFSDISPCIVTPSGYLVACDVDAISVYKKIFIV